MPKFSKRSSEKLYTCHDDIIKICLVAIKYYDFSVIWGFRNEAEQNEIFRQGFSKLKWDESTHNKFPSMGIDLTPYPTMWTDRDKLIQLSGIIHGVAMGLYSIGIISHLIRWGGDWNQNWDIKDETFIDMAHFELIGV